MAGGLSPNQIVAALDAEEAATALRPLLREGDAVLVKGSHFMGLEKLVAGLARKDPALMLYYLSLFLRPIGGRSTSFATRRFGRMAAALTSLLLSLALGPRIILLLTRLKLGQPLRQKSEVRELADLHSGKKGTPTMGGILILVTVDDQLAALVRPGEPPLLARARLDALPRLHRFRRRLRESREEKFQGHPRLAEDGRAGAAGDFRLPLSQLLRSSYPRANGTGSTFRSSSRPSSIDMGIF